MPLRRRVRTVVDAFRADDASSDALVAALTFVVGVLLILAGMTEVFSGIGWALTEGADRWWHALPLAVGCVAMLRKRSRPMAALAVGALAMVADLAIGGSLGVVIVLWDLLYAAGLYAGPGSRRVLTGTTTGLVVAATIAAARLGTDLRGALFAGLQLGVLLWTPLWWAANVRHKSELAELAAQQARLERQRAADLERIADLGRHEAVQAERAAMARDLHDIIASHLSAIAIHSGAALATPPDADRDRAALESVRASSVASLEEMRAMIMLLRSDLPREGSTEPVMAPARLGHLAELVAGAEAAGLEVTVEDARVVQDRDLPAAVDQAAHRIVQEALTNATKHAPGSAVVVALEPGPSGLALTVTNGLPGPARPIHPALSAGTGMVTMRERAEALGGTFEAGPVADGPAAWRVRAHLPLHGGPV